MEESEEKCEVEEAGVLYVVRKITDWRNAGKQTGAVTRSPT
jgi:hypothetical protein